VNLGMPEGGGLHYYQPAAADALDSAPLSVARVCRACLGARRCKSSLQAREAEGEGKRQGVTVRWGLKEAWNEDAGRGTRTRYEA
jgi:hypothetical protein